MNRRRALWGIVLLGGSGLAAGGITWLGWHKKPDLDYLISHKPLLAALTETILPATDTPGAIEAGVPDFLLKMLLENTAPLEQNRFISGMQSADTYSLNRYQKPYIHCSPAQQQAVMQQVEDNGKPRGGVMGKIERKLLGESFFGLLKSYTCLGYYTSMTGATRGLAYAPIPGRFVGCMPLSAGQKAWATK